MKLKPKPLKRGSIIKIVAPAGLKDTHKLSVGARILQDMGFKVELGDNLKLLRRRGYVSGEDVDRAEEINEAFENEGVDGIVCAQGGYGSLRILSLINYKLVARNPKVFVGYSDITSLHLAIYKKTGLVTFHGPMVISDFGLEITEYTKAYFLKAIMSDEPLGKIANPPDGRLIQTIKGGVARGELIGGNLTLIQASIGTEFEVDLKGKNLLLEDVNESPYRVDRMITHLLLARRLQGVAGVVFGEFIPPEYDEAYMPSFEEVIRDRATKIDAPSIFGFPFGHGKNKATIPLGVEAILDADNREITIVEGATEN